MDIAVLSGDLMFFSAVEGVAGAMGHRARQVESVSEIGAPAMLVVDARAEQFDVASVAAAFDPLRTALFAPHEHVAVFAAARASGIAHVHRRGALASELPRLI